MRIVSVKEIILDKIFPSFISAKQMQGFGYAVNIFYGPLTTYIPILFSFFTKSSILGLKIFTFFTVLFSGTAMYNFIYKVSKKRIIALISALIYISAPYKLTDIYSRNAVGEYSAFVFIPIVFSGLYDIFNGNKKKHYLLVIGAVGIILSHTITTVYCCFFALIYILANWRKLKQKDVLKYIFIDLCLILLLTAFYLIPLVEHKMYGDYTVFNSYEMNTTGDYVWSTGIGFKDFISSEFGKQEIVFSIGIVIAFCICLTPICFKKLRENKEYLLFLILSVLSLIMCTKLFPWKIMPNILTVTQFAWRLEGFFVFFVSYVCACNIMWLSESLKDKKNIIGIFVIICTIICSYFGTARYIEKNNENGKSNFDEEKRYEDSIMKAEIIEPYQINREYLPVKLVNNIDYITKRTSGVYVLDGRALIVNQEKNGFNFTFRAEGVNDAKLELPYIYYHGYTTYVNGKEIENYESENGFIEINLNEDGDVVVKYTGTDIEKAGYIISAITLLGIIVYCITKKFKNREK